MGWIYHDPDEYETVTEYQEYGKLLGHSMGSFSVSYKRRSDEEIFRIKEQKRKEYEDSVLAEAEGILARRKLLD